MQAKKLRIASLIITHNRIDEAKAQMDIIREFWQPNFGSLDIYHEYNGQKDWYPQKYKEDSLHRNKKMSHFLGVNHMLSQGMKHVLNSGKKYDFIIATSADVWFFDPKKLKKVILSCYKKRAQLATSLWMGVALGTEFFIITPELAKKAFPLKLTALIKRYKLMDWVNLGKIGIFETLFTLQMIRLLKNPQKIYLIPGRRVVLPTNRYWSPSFYASHHDRNKRKRDILSKIKSITGDNLGNMPSLHKFLV
ncbi:hypothetical protein HYS95_02155 [Candidatus Daviesbacteria bacterium]|nr:hypothetical protein [Candidatus Daviesbacteria bacterium]